MSNLEEHLREQALITAMCEAGTCDHAECHDDSGPVKEYTFDAQMRICVRVKAESESAARKLLESHLVAADCNGGAWPNGDPILFEASLTYENPELIEVDGEAV